MNKTKLARAVSMAIAGSALSMAAFNASATVTTMYNMSTGGATDISTNTTNPTATGSWVLSGTTDGWANGAKANFATGTIANEKWYTADNAGNPLLTTAAPFGYTGAHMNWGVEVTGGNGGTGTISTFDSFSRYGAYADIDTAKGAWSALNTGTKFGGWRHDLDVGLFKSDTSGLVTLNVTGILQTGNFGFTIFKGMDAVTKYNHHGQWNNFTNTQVGAPDAYSSPYNTTLNIGAPAINGAVLAGTSLSVPDMVAYSIGNDPNTAANEEANLNTIQFFAQAGQVYSIFLGGYRNGNWGDTTDGYQLTISQVPVPGAVWLFGSALVGMIGFGGRKAKA